ncbi:MAG: stage VI sporulation protein F [Bacilli bacterium]|nr:stage VI sporulation protein F [Bacilli bacterium]MBR4672045.1 stage VI sporulation protein F [Bacilli bacterium]
MFKDSLFKKIEDKTNVDKNTILSLANKLQNGNMKDEKTLSELIDNLSIITNTKVTDEKKQKIINTIVNDKVPSNIDKMV